MIRKHSRLPVDDVLDGGAKVTGASQITLKRYLRTETSIEGEYQIVFDDILEKYVVEFKVAGRLGITGDLIGAI
jgi:hypothetical protein